jgi:perosamine synthetase
LKNIPLSNPDITQMEVDQVLEVLGTPYLSRGSKLDEFEKLVADFTGTRFAIAVNSGTSALHLIVRALDITDGDEVITSPFSFIASANCLLFERAKPVFVDIDPATLNIDVNKIADKITDRTRGILPVDILGLPADWDEIIRIAQKYNLQLIEDSCEALGAEYKGKKAGSFGTAGTFGFYPNKQITTGEGGVIVTDNPQLAELCGSMRNQGREYNGDWFQHVRLGYNYRLSEMSCAIGIAQMKRIKEILNKREKVAELYNLKLSGIEEISTLPGFPDIKRSWFVYIVIFSEKYNNNQRDKIAGELVNRGIGCARYFAPLHLQPFYIDMFGYKKGDFPVTESIGERTLALPFYTGMTEDDIDIVVNNLKDILYHL